MILKEMVIFCFLIVLASHAQPTKVWSASAESSKTNISISVENAHNLGFLLGSEYGSEYFSYMSGDSLHIVDFSTFSKVLDVSMGQISYDTSAYFLYVWLYKNLYADDSAWNFVTVSLYSSPASYVLNLYQNETSIFKKELWTSHPFPSFYRNEDNLYMIIYTAPDSLIECYQIRAGLPIVSSIKSTQASNISGVAFLPNVAYDVMGRKISAENYKNMNEFIKQAYLK